MIDPQAYVQQLKSELATILIEAIKQQGWKQKVAAEKLSMTQPRVSNLYKGQLEKFSIDFFIGKLALMGHKTIIDFSKK